MARLILDTTVLVDAERGLARLGEELGDEDSVAVAALSLAELRVGLELAAEDSVRRRRQAFLERISALLEVEDYGRAVAREHGVLLAHTRRAGRPRGAHDLILAATARATDRTLVTTDQRGFAGLPGVTVRLLD